MICRLRCSSIVFVITFSQLVNAEEIDLVKAFFSTSGIEDKPSAYYGEMLEFYVNKPTLGESIPKTTNRSFRLLEKSEHRAIYAVLLSDAEHSQDWYTYLVKDGDKWKVSAIRSLALPSLFYSVLQQAENKKKRTEKEEADYQNMLLMIKPDYDLKAFAISHFTTLKKISVLANSKIEEANSLAKTLYLNFVEVKTGGVVNINIGGVLDNSVGYLYVPKDSTQPSMSDNHYIYLEEFADGWFIYKTT